MTKEEFENMKFGADMFCEYINPLIKINNEAYKITAVNFYEGLVELSDGMSENPLDYFWARHENIRIIGTQTVA